MVSLLTILHYVLWGVTAVVMAYATRESWSRWFGQATGRQVAGPPTPAPRVFPEPRAAGAMAFFVGSFAKHEDGGGEPPPPSMPELLNVAICVISVGSFAFEMFALATHRTLISNWMWSQVANYPPIAWFGGILTALLAVALLYYRGEALVIRFLMVVWLVVFAHFFWQAGVVYGGQVPKKTAPMYGPAVVRS